MKSLRGKSAKQKFIREYKDVRVLTYAALLNDNEKPSQCGGKLVDKHYQFSAIHKVTGQKVIFYLGCHCGEELMQMLSIPIDSIRFFNPFKTGLNAITNNTSNTSKDRQIQPTRLANELFEIINIIYMGLNLKDTHILDDMIMDLRENIGKEPEAYKFASINTILGKYKKTISIILDELQQNNQPFKKFDFTQSRDYFLKEYLIKNNRENEKINF